MKSYNNKFKIYKFEGLGELKKDNFYDDYLIIVYGEGERGAWYLFRKEEMDDDYKPYLRKNLRVTDPVELQNIIDAFNEALKDESYETIKAIKIWRNQYTSSANTDKGIKLSTKGCKGTVGYSWKKRRNKYGSIG
jgi:hypothetical protein